MGSYLFERSNTDEAGREPGNSLEDDVTSALRELDWVEEFSLHADDGDGTVVVVDVHFDPDWPDTANPEYVAEVFERFGVRTIAPAPVVGKVVAADPLRVGTVTSDDAIDLLVLDD